MCFGPIPDRANLFRHSVFPVSFRSRRFAAPNFFNLNEKVHDGQNIVVASVAWQTYMPTSNYVHRYGCRLADKRNKRKQEKGTYKEKDRQVYCGAYQLTAGAVREISTVTGLEEIESADVYHLIEDGEIAHTELKFVFKTGAAITEAAKTAIIDRLWHACAGPMPFICEQDTEMTNHPSEKLEDAPNGRSENAEPKISTWIKFYLCLWINKLAHRELWHFAP